MKISVWHRELSDSYLRFVTQLGADALDFGTDTDIPGVAEQGYPDLDELLKVKKKNPVLGPVDQPRQPAQYHGKIYDRSTRRRKRTRKYLYGIARTWRSRRTHCPAAILGRHL